MNEFLIFFLIASFFSFTAVCMNPSYTDQDLPSPRLPENVKFGDCFVVPRITGEVLNTALYSYHHICPEKAAHDGPELPEGEKLWYIIGSFRESETSQEQDPSSFHYVRAKQSLMKFVFMKEEMVEFVFTFANFQIKFDSPQQSQAFYRIIYHNPNMIEVAPNKIGVLHEIMLLDGPDYREMGNNVEALHEKINGTEYITLKNDLGEALLIFSKNEAEISRIKHANQRDIQQLLLRINTAFYILTFSNPREAREFSKALLTFVKTLHMGHVFGPILSRFKDNRIQIGS